MAESRNEHCQVINFFFSWDVPNVFVCTESLVELKFTSLIVKHGRVDQQCKMRLGTKRAGKEPCTYRNSLRLSQNEDAQFLARSTWSLRVYVRDTASCNERGEWRCDARCHGSMSMLLWRGGRSEHMAPFEGLNMALFLFSISLS